MRSSEKPSFGAVVDAILAAIDDAKHVAINFTGAFLAKRRVWFYPQEVTAPGADILLSQEISGSDLIQTAAKVAGVPTENFVQFAAIQLARQTILDDYRARAGSPTATGASNAKIAAAYDELIKANVAPTPTRLRDRAGTNSLACIRWLMLHYPEHL